MRWMRSLFPTMLHRIKRAGLGTGINRNDVNTWTDDRWPPYVDGGIIPAYGMGQSAAQVSIPAFPISAHLSCLWQWHVRGNENVKKAFEASPHPVPALYHVQLISCPVSWPTLQFMQHTMQHTT